ncbi:MAG: hypothetical protein LBN07_04420 [Christensenellaceae bacterium]|jgi:hypothetical protein|nr:hypothetical protein [Christensenellaceae bacterium]
MNKLLPELQDLIPITQERVTFSDCGFNKPFNQLSFEVKLKVINDIVRQSMLFDSYPDPSCDTEQLIGDCHTVALASIEYMNYLGIGTNYRYVMCGPRPFDPEDIVSRHGAVLVDDEHGNTYFYDATPLVGYGYGKVAPLTQDMVYCSYEKIEGESFKFLHLIRDFLYQKSCNAVKEKDIPQYLEVLNGALNYSVLNGYLAFCYEELASIIKSENNNLLKSELETKAYTLNPYSHCNPNYTLKKQEKESLKLQQIETWKDELSVLTQNNSDWQKQLQLAQNIMGEFKTIDNHYEVIFDVEGCNKSISSLTPRFF